MQRVKQVVSIRVTKFELTELSTRKLRKLTRQLRESTRQLKKVHITLQNYAFMLNPPNIFPFFLLTRHKNLFPRHERERAAPPPSGIEAAPLSVCLQLLFLYGFHDNRDNRDNTDNN